MSKPLPRLRNDLDFMPSPVEDRPGLLIRDSFQYSDAVLIIPPPLVPCLACFDGEHTELDLRQALVRITGELDVSAIANQLATALSTNGFLEDETYSQLKAAKHGQFAADPVREPSHAGSAYPDTREDLQTTMAEWMEGGSVRTSNLVGIAAPHVSPGGGFESYRAAYRLVGSEYRDKTFVILGTSHYGQPERYGLTRKPYRTPFGDTVPALNLIDELAAAAPASVVMEDYCHAVEHSIEFQVLFLQSIFGPDIRVLPILCGSYAKSIYGTGGMPEESEQVKRFLGSLGEMAAREGDRLFWVLGIDMAHMGKRYGDDFDAVSGEGEMERVGTRDLDRLDRINAGDSQGFWQRVQENHDDLKWCGSSPLYTFLKVKPEVRGTLERYEQWNIDEASVVSFAGISFR